MVVTNCEFSTVVQMMMVPSSVRGSSIENKWNVSYYGFLNT